MPWPATPGQQYSYRQLDTVQRVGMSSNRPQAGDEAAMAAESADRAASAEWAERALRDLPQRPVSHRCSVPRIRRMDDPEILERVLEGLINLA
jgi:hypothetical protein